MGPHKNCKKKMVRYVETGRVAYIRYGPHYGKLCVITDILDQNRAIVDGPGLGVGRHQLNFKWMALTEIKMDISRGLRHAALARAIKKQKVLETFQNSAWGKLVQHQKARANLNDFGRFKVTCAKKQRNSAAKKELSALKKAQK